MHSIERDNNFKILINQIQNDTDLYKATRSLDLRNMPFRFQDNSDLKNKISQKGLLYISKCVTNHYYENSTTGKIQKFFEGFLKFLFNRETSVEFADKAIKALDEQINGCIFDFKALNLASFEAYRNVHREITINCARMTNKTIRLTSTCYEILKRTKEDNNRSIYQTAICRDLTTEAEPTSRSCLFPIS